MTLTDSESSAQLRARFLECRGETEARCAPLSPEDHMLQGAPFASPPKWHLAHTTWFFDTFVLREAGDAATCPEIWATLFNSYYNGIGRPHPRDERGILSRPSLTAISDWRQMVTASVADGITAGRFGPALLERIALGVQHEMQHQELLLTDLLFSLSRNPELPAYDPVPPPVHSPQALNWQCVEAGIVDIGSDGSTFAFDNEGPRHRQFIESFSIADRCVTQGEYREFVEAGGYTDPQWWLADGWALVASENWQRPLYWLNPEQRFSLHGVIDIDANAPVTHLSGFEADAYARWSGSRLPTEFEWECAATAFSPPGIKATPAFSTVSDWHGAVWQWTQSSYTAYPGFRTAEGAVGEYNGKFMGGQNVLRGSSVVTPADQRRHPYRNFFYLADRWQFTGLRLARSDNF